MRFPALKSLLEKAIAHRRSFRSQDNASRVTWFDPPHDLAFRLFNGFTEGCPDVVLDVYGHTLMVQNYAYDPTQVEDLLRDLVLFVRDSLNWLRAGIFKHRNGTTQEARRGMITFGESLDSKINEHGVWYALDLTMNRDSSFYLDTRNVRKWLIDNVRDKTVLNTFAYTGSLGVAAYAGGASRVVQVDRNRKFLDLAGKSCALNNFRVGRGDLTARDFFPAVAGYKKAGQLFDCAILDPPFFSVTSRGRVDQVKESVRLINKVRPLINDGGWLVAINNALYVSGSEYMQTLENLCRDGYLEIRELIPVPEDVTGFEKSAEPITDPSPFNHSTKIAILDVKRK